MKFVDKYALVPIERYNQLIKQDKTNIIEAENISSDEGKIADPENIKSDEGKHGVSSFENQTGAGQSLSEDKQENKNDIEKKSINSIEKKQISEKPFSLSDDYLKRRNLSEKSKQIKPQRRIRQKIKVAPLPPGTPNKPLKNYFHWEKIF
jgi:hypothetical protein